MIVRSGLVYNFVTKRKEGSPNIIGRISLLNMADSSLPRFRAYVHSSGSREAFGGGQDLGVLYDASDYFMECLRRRVVGKNNNAHFLAVLWGDKGHEVADIFRFSIDDTWPGNPEVSAFVFKDGVYRPRDSITCGDGAIILGIEEQYRRKTRDLVEFMLNHPRIPGLRFSS